jgi:NAD(P)-dependent dehydrogenase (short-subunit alcohol dehydrogenase family)
MGRRARLEGKRVLFIGGVTNIGAASVRLLVEEGARVVIGDLNAQAGASLAAELGDSVRFVSVDVRSEASVAALVASAVDWLGGLDALCQNAGLLRVGAVEDFAAEDWDAVFAVNSRAQFFAVKHAVAHMKRAGGGSIVNMSSLAGKKGGPGRTAYSASKGAVIGFGASLAAELAPFGIRVNTLCPGWIDTAFNDPAVDIIGGKSAVEDMVTQTVPLGRQGTPEEVAPMFAFLVSEESSYITAQSFNIDGGFYS